MKVRLINGSTEYEGRVEVYYNDTWGTVCDYGWDFSDAGVVCRQLGFGPAVDVAYYGRGSGEIWLTYVDCAGTESAIGDCSHVQWSNDFYYYCSHYDDAGVRCAESNGMEIFLTYMHIRICAAYFVINLQL